MDDNVKKDDKEDLVVEIKEFFDLVATNDSENREGWLDDIKFYSGQQWPDQLKRMRESDPNGPRPCLTINKLPLHVRQITNDVRQNKPAIKVHPVDDKGDVKMAEVLNGVIKHIEYQSDADIAYENANFYQVVAGVGYWQVITEVLDETTNQQDIFVKPVSNIFTVYYDPNCECPFGSDAERVLITSEMPPWKSSRRSTQMSRLRHWTPLQSVTATMTGPMTAPSASACTGTRRRRRPTSCW